MNHTEVSFDNRTGVVHFENFFDGNDVCDERMLLFNGTCLYTRTDCQFKDKGYAKIQYVLTSGSQNFSIDIYKSGNITETTH